jgi:hypothetical protein
VHFSPGVSSVDIQGLVPLLVISGISWPKYSEGGRNMVWQTGGSSTEEDVSGVPVSVFWSMVLMRLAYTEFS